MRREQIHSHDHGHYCSAAINNNINTLLQPILISAAPSCTPQCEALDIFLSRRVKECVSFVRHFWLLFASWDSSNGFFEVRRFCVFPTRMDNINVMDLIKVCSKDVDERVERIWRLNTQPAMTNKAPNGIVGEVHFVRFGGTPGKVCVRAPKYSHGLRVPYHLFPFGTLVFVRLRLKRPHTD